MVTVTTAAPAGLAATLTTGTLTMAISVTATKTTDAATATLKAAAEKAFCSDIGYPKYPELHLEPEGETRSGDPFVLNIKRSYGSYKAIITKAKQAIYPS